MTQGLKPRPVGLTILASINIISFAVVGLYLVALGFEMIENPPGQVTIVIESIAGILALLSGIGFLLRHRILGYLLGNVFCIYLLIYSAAVVLVKVGVKPLEYFNWLAYPVILILALNIMYRKEFTGSREAMEKDAV
jgi:hypothetical protein